MARQEEDREDLLAEATALVERVELRSAAFTDPVVVGFRSQGAASFYFGAQPAYHFTAAAELRRAYAGGLLYKAERGKLVSLDRRRSAGQVQLIRHELDAAETHQFLLVLSNTLQALRESLDAKKCELVCQHPPTADMVGRVCAWLARHAEITQLASSAKVQ